MSRSLVVAGVIGVLSCGGAGGGAGPESAQAPKTPPGDHGVDLANLKAQLPPFLDAVGGGSELRAFSGYVLVAQHDQVIFERAGGFADIAAKRAPTADTSFRVGSVTKQFTAAAILRLEQDGKLSVDDKVGKYLPEYPGPGKDVTIHQLLTHTGGIPSYTEMPEIMERRAEPITVKALLAAFWDKPLVFPPGTKHAYSNSGYAILGAIIERVSGMSYGEYLKTHLFAPAKLTHTEVGDAIGVADRAEGYAMDADGRKPAHAIDMSLPFSAGAVRSTANDLMRWHRALSGDAILSAAEKAKLYKPSLDKYAYGWVVDEIHGHPVVWHNGGIDGFGTSYWRVLDADLVVVAWANVGGIAVDPIGRGAVEAALGGKLTPEPKEVPGTLDAALVERLVGTYAITEEGKAALAKLGAPPKMIESVDTIELSATPKGLKVKPRGQGEAELGPSADGSFYDPASQVRIRPELPASGPVKSFTLEQGPLKVTYRR